MHNPSTRSKTGRQYFNKKTPRKEDEDLHENVTPTKGRLENNVLLNQHRIARESIEKDGQLVMCPSGIRLRKKSNPKVDERQIEMQIKHLQLQLDQDLSATRDQTPDATTLRDSRPAIPEHVRQR